MKHTIKCPNCTAPLEVEEGDAYAVRCSYCGMSTPIPEALRKRAGAGNSISLSDADVSKIVALIAAGRDLDAIRTIQRIMNVDLGAARRLHDAMKTGDAVTLDELLHGEGLVGPTVVVRPRSCLGSLILWGIVLTVVGVVLVTIVSNVIGYAWLRSVINLLPSTVSERVETVVEKAVPPFAGLAFQRQFVFVDDDDARHDFVAIAFDIQTSESLLAYVEASSNTVRWRSTVDSQSSFVVADEAVYAATKSRLRAIDRRSGATRWEASLTDEVSSACDACVIAAAGRVYVLSNDAEVQAFDAADGRKVWSETLSPVTPRIMPWGDRLVVVDRDTEHPQGAAGRLRVFDAEGDSSPGFHPSCETPRTDSSVGSQEYADPDNAMHIDAAEGTVYVWLGGFSSCLQKYSLADGALLWSAPLDAEAEDARETQFLHSGNTLYVVGDDSILSADVAGGEVKVLYRPDDDMDGMVLHGESAGALIFHSATNRGTRRFMLNALDVDSGQLRWTTRFDEDGGPFTLDADYTGLLSNSTEETAWTPIVTPSSVRLLRISSKPFRFIFENIDAVTGVADGRVEAPLAGDPLILGPALVGRRGDLIWVHLDGDYAVLDTAAKKVVARIGR